MADLKISALTASTVPLAGTEVLPIVQSSTTKQVSIANVTAGRAVSSLTTTALGPNGIPITLQEITAAPSSATAAYVGVSTSAFPGGANGDLILIPRTSGANDVRVYVGSGTPTEALVVQGSTKDVRVQTGNLVMATSGKGIDFSATPGTGTSELFADYEEGTWTPTLIGTTTNPTVTYGLQRGVYTKVGRVVTVSAYIGWSAFSGGSGNVAFGNLPFTIESSVGSSCGGSIANFDGFTLSAARTSVGLLGASNTTYGAPTCFGSAVSSQYIGVGSVAASGSVIYTLTYSV